MQYTGACDEWRNCGPSLLLPLLGGATLHTIMTRQRSSLPT